MLTLLKLLLAIGPSLALEWYQIGPVYQVYPASFADSDGDGTGDIKGVESHVDYFVSTGVGAIWLNPIFESPMRDNGYDVTNYTAINPLFGTMEDVESLLSTLHDNGIKLLLDYVPNHTSNESTWFQDSINKTNGKEDFYVWMDSSGTDSDGNPLPPNNWISAFGGSAWTWNDARQQFYYHAFGDYQPDLNYSNPDVLDAIKETMVFWLDKGIDGFRMDAVVYLGETNYTQNETFIADCVTDSDMDTDCLNHSLTQNQNLTYEVLKNIDEMIATNYSDRGVFLEVYSSSIEKVMNYYANVSSPFNFQLISYVTIDTNASALEEALVPFLEAVPDGKWPNWVMGNHDNSRVGTRMGSDLIDAMNMLVQLLPGTSITYYGEEIGMTDGNVRDDQIQDPSDGRDPERTPMQWNNSINAGFSTNITDPYLPANTDYWAVNVAAYQNSTEDNHYTIYKKLVALHKELINTTTNTLDSKVITDWVWGFKRANHVVIVNLNNEESTFTLSDWDLPTSVMVRIPSLNSGFSVNDTINTTSTIYMAPRSGLVLYTNGTTSGATSLTVFSSLIAFLVVICLRQSLK